MDLDMAFRLSSHSLPLAKPLQPTSVTSFSFTSLKAQSPNTVTSEAQGIGTQQRNFWGCSSVHSR